MLLRVELHMHTTASDGRPSPEQAVRAAARKGLHVVAVTDHNTFRGASLAMRASRVINGVTVVPGSEVRTEYGDVNVLCPQLPRGEAPRVLAELRDWATENSCILVAVHPYNVMVHGIGPRVARLLHYFDAIEVWNAHGLPQFNLPAMLLAKRSGLPAVSGSDAHVAEEIGVAPTIIESETSPEAVVEAIARGRTRPSIGLPGPKTLLAVAAWSIERRLARFKPLPEAP